MLVIAFRVMYFPIGILCGYVRRATAKCLWSIYTQAERTWRDVNEIQTRRSDNTTSKLCYLKDAVKLTNRISVYMAYWKMEYTLSEVRLVREITASHHICYIIIIVKLMRGSGDAEQKIHFIVRIFISLTIPRGINLRIAPHTLPTSWLGPTTFIIFFLYLLFIVTISFESPLRCAVSFNNKNFKKIF